MTAELSEKLPLSNWGFVVDMRRWWSCLPTAGLLQSIHRGVGYHVCSSSYSPSHHVLLITSVYNLLLTVHTILSWLSCLSTILFLQPIPFSVGYHVCPQFSSCSPYHLVLVIMSVHNRLLTVHTMFPSLLRLSIDLFEHAIPSGIEWHAWPHPSS